MMRTFEIRIGIFTRVFKELFHDDERTSVLGWRRAEGCASRVLAFLRLVVGKNDNCLLLTMENTAAARVFAIV